MSDEIKEILDELESLFEVSEAPEHIINGFNKIKDYITNLQILYDKATTDLVKESQARIKLQEENDYLKDIVSNTELSDEIKKADKWSKRELYKINYQRLKVNQRLIEENERLKNIINELEKASDEIFHKYPYERHQWFLKLKEMKGENNEDNRFNWTFNKQ